MTSDKLAKRSLDEDEVRQLERLADRLAGSVASTAEATPALPAHESEAEDLS